MRKNLGVLPAVYPMPVLMVASYDKNNTVQILNAAWGMICAEDKIALFIDKEHATTKAIMQSKAFTVSLADKSHIDVADYFGIATGNKYPDKFAKTGFHAEKSIFVNAPIISEFPLTMECELQDILDSSILHAVIGKIKNVSVDEKILDDDGKVNPSKIEALVFDQFKSGYYVIGDKVGQAWNSGKDLFSKYCK